MELVSENRTTVSSQNLLILERIKSQVPGFLSLKLVWYYGEYHDALTCLNRF